MTIAISIKVHDGVVLATDSAASLLRANGVVNVYDNADKIFNLRKGSPIGATTWGIGGIGQTSISTLAKDLRARLIDDDKEWRIDPESYTIEEVAKKARRFFFEEHYEPEFKEVEKPPNLGFLIVGYSAGAGLAEEWEVLIKDGECADPTLVRPQAETGFRADGEPEAISRLLFGFSPGLRGVLKDLGVSNEQIIPAMTRIQATLQTPLQHPAMPIQDAIDLAEFLADLTIKFARFRPGAPTVGGPIEVAAITKHEGFRWVKRKHYFDARLNPPLTRG